MTSAKLVMDGEKMDQSFVDKLEKQYKVACEKRNVARFILIPYAPGAVQLGTRMMELKSSTQTNAPEASFIRLPGSTLNTGVHVGWRWRLDVSCRQPWRSSLASTSQSSMVLRFYQLTSSTLESPLAPTNRNKMNVPPRLSARAPRE